MPSEEGLVLPETSVSTSSASGLIKSCLQGLVSQPWVQSAFCLGFVVVFTSAQVPHH